ncbi:MAG TPA: glycine--tRNA ligase [bacterium]|jgi:glycyl-tRNA synthetase
MAKQTVMDKVVSLCKRRGFVFQSSEIYGGLSSTWDYGPLGVELKNNIAAFWWREMTQLHENIVGIDAAILMHPRVWEASGHVAGFVDPLVDCKQCKARFKAQDLVKTWRQKKKIEALGGADIPEGGESHMENLKLIHWSEAMCPNCGTTGMLTEPRLFNLMLKTFLGPVEEAAAAVYLRPETAQGIYVNYQNVVNTARVKIPFGIAQIGKAFRNEITPGNFIFRTREFEQMEMQFFVRPGEDKQWLEKWRDARFQYYLKLGIRPEKLRLHQHTPQELAHYAADAFDIEYEFPFGWQELEGIHDRTDFDLKRHAEFSGKDLSYFDEEAKERFIPYIVETSAGLNRTLLTCMVDAYDEDTQEGEPRVVLHLSPKIAPIKVGIFSLVKKDGLPDVADKIASDLRKVCPVFTDHQGSIGRRYRRMDEIGTPWGITVDYQTLEDHTVTLRDRDTLEQVRVSTDKVVDMIRGRLEK